LQDPPQQDLGARADALVAATVFIIALEAMQPGRLKRLPPRGRQLVLRDLVEEGLVADLENTRCLGSIPPYAFEHRHEGIALGFPRAATRDLPQALGDDRRGLRRSSVPVLAACGQGPKL